MHPIRLVAFLLLTMVLAACATGGLSSDQVAGVVVGGTSAFVLFVEDLLKAGVIDQATAAKLMASAGAIRDITEATRGAIAPIADAVGRLQAKSASLWTGPEIVGASSVALGGAVATVRAIRGPAAGRGERAKRLTGQTG